MLTFLFSNKRRFVRQKLELARQQLEAGQYNEAFLLCQQARQVAGNSMAKEILYTGACALFGLGHIHQAEQWMREHKSSAKQNSSYLYLTAYLALHRKQPEQALLDWTSILQLDPSQSFADQLIERIKRSEKQVIEEVATPDCFSRYVPVHLMEDYSTTNKAWLSLGKQGIEKDRRAELGMQSRPYSSYSWKLKRSGLLVFLVLLGLALFFSLAKNKKWDMARLLALLQGKAKELDLNLPKAPSRGTLILPEQYQGKPPPFIYKERDAFIADYKKARRNILVGRVNQARLILGRLELSNVGFEIKKRVLLLRASIPFLERSDFYDSLSIQEVQAQPYLYRGAQIFWQAKLQAIIPKAKEIILKLEKSGESKESSKGSSIENSTGKENKVLLVSYTVPPSQKKELLAQLNTQNEIQVFGTFQSIESGQFKIQARELILLESATSN